MNKAERIKRFKSMSSLQRKELILKKMKEKGIKEITENIVKQIPTLIDKKMDLFSSKVNQNLNGI